MRALAVIPVVLFHADIPGFQGGFVGVDVFFVISGFLISSIIFNELDSGTFCFAQFWERRARRILPALLTVTLVTLLLGWFVLLPEDYAFLGESAWAQSLFASNFLFWRESGGYFARNALEIPLLHTWSLAVEEQFYLLFPLAAFAVTTYALRLRASLAAATVALSFATSVWTVSYTDAGFWLLPSRAWELGIVVLLALGSQRLQRFARGIAAEAAGVLGLALIGIAVASYDKSTAFPGFAALLPVGGTALVIWANSARLTSTGRILAAKPAVLLGSISYSLYLWHWPLLALARYSLAQQLSLSSIASVVLASIVLVYLSCRFVEAPFRHRKGLPARLVMFAGAAAAIVLTGVAGFVIEASEGMPDRHPQVGRSPFGECRFATRSRIETVRDLCLFGPSGAEPRSSQKRGRPHCPARGGGVVADARHESSGARVE